MAGRNRLGGLAANPIINHYERGLDNERLCSAPEDHSPTLGCRPKLVSKPLGTGDRVDGRQLGNRVFPKLHDAAGFSYLNYEVHSDKRIVRASCSYSCKGWL
jgi:hypothetical protein